jgi:hypothetical protein
MHMRAQRCWGGCQLSRSAGRVCGVLQNGGKLTACAGAAGRTMLRRGFVMAG